MASLSISFISDNRQLKRELAALSPRDGRALMERQNRGDQVIWITEAYAEGAIVCTPRLCFG